MKRWAFTVIELIVTVTVIAVLAALIFPALAAAKRSSYKTVCVSNLRQLGVAIALYREEWSDFRVAYGSPETMGLPPNASVLLTGEAPFASEGLFDCRGIDAFGSGKPVYTSMWPHPASDSAVLDSWLQYVRTNEGQSVLLTDINHNSGSIFSPFVVHLGLGLTIDTSVRVFRKKGDPNALEWWQ